jgi:DNA-binding NtrC family response regulator
MTQQPNQHVLLVGRNAAGSVPLDVLAGRDIRAAVVDDARAAVAELRKRPCDLVLAELGTCGGGLDLLDAARKIRPEIPFAVFSEEDSAATAMKALRAGCDDFLVAPVSGEALERLLDRFLPRHEVALAAECRGADGTCRIAGKSRRLLEAVDLARRIAPASLPVLITGESGTGKELVAYLIHCHSRRRHRPYVRVNCAALSESLLESELFGHERGAFTGAVRQRKGCFERADGGTLLLDEISETGPRLQAELLRVLEHQDFERLGGSESIRCDVRVVATTNRDLPAAVERGRFRRDLYYRISGARLELPALRDRREDIPVLVWHFVNECAREAGRRITGLDPSMLELFMRHPWPGNVRQLRNVVRSALILGGGAVLSLHDAGHVLSEVKAAAAEVASRLQGGDASGDLATLQLQELERLAIFEALRRTKSNQAKAARLLGITDRTLREKLRRYRREAAGAGEGAPAADDGREASKNAPPGDGPPRHYLGEARWQKTPA